MHVHAGVQVFLDLVHHGVGRQRDDRRAPPPATRLDGADFAGGRDAVHHRHLDVHQDQVVVASGPGLDRLLAVRNDVDGQAEGGDHRLQHQLVGGVVLGRQDAQRGDLRR